MIQEFLMMPPTAPAAWWFGGGLGCCYRFLRCICGKKAWFGAAAVT